MAKRLANGELRYNRFHTTALCSPTRAALLCGRNHHSVGMGLVTETATSAPGYTSLRPAKLGERLQLADGWQYRVRVPDEDLIVRGQDSLAHIVLDQFDNNYQSEG